MDYRKLIATRLLKLCEERGWNARDLARESGVNPSLVYKYLDQSSTASIENLAKLTSVFGVSVSAILDDGKEPQIARQEYTPQESLQVVAKALSRIEQLEARIRELEALPSKSGDEMLDEMLAEAKGKAPTQKRGAK